MTKPGTRTVEPDKVVGGFIRGTEPETDKVQ